MVDLTRVLTPAEGRDIETITGEILDAQRRGGEAILTIGRCLIEAKEKLHHGEWLPWLNERVSYSERTAQNLMAVARKYSNPQTLADLGMAKAIALLALPDWERDEFIEGHNVIDMSARELKQAIKERDEARAAAEHAQADAAAAEQALAAAQEQLERLRRENKLSEDLSSDKDLAQFELLYGQAKETVNKMHGILLKVKRRDEDAAGRLGKTLRALAEAVGRCAE